MTTPYLYELSDRHDVAAFVPQQYRTVLEVGCGRGGFKENLRKDVEIWGIEPNALAAAEAAERGYKMLIGLYDDVADQLKDGYFDLIICNDVIEHMVDHDAFLKKVSKKLMDEGFIIGSIPNVRYFQNLYRLVLFKEWQYADTGILDRTHLRFFTEKSLSRSFQESGYYIDDMKGINNILGRPWESPGRILRNVILLLLAILSFGYFRDILYTHFGFRLRTRS